MDYVGLKIVAVVIMCAAIIIAVSVMMYLVGDSRVAVPNPTPTTHTLVIEGTAWYPHFFASKWYLQRVESYSIMFLSCESFFP